VFCNSSYIQALCFQETTQHFPAIKYFKKKFKKTSEYVNFIFSGFYIDYLFFLYKQRQQNLKLSYPSTPNQKLKSLQDLLAYRATALEYVPG